MRHIARKAAYATASILALSSATGAMAQASAPVAKDQIASSSTDGVGDIVVTARKRSESLKDVPASILAIGAAQLQNLNAKSLQDLNGSAPNFSLNPQDGTLTIRGISSNARNVGFESGAAIYIDGVYQGRPIGNNQDLTDISRVEVLRGPQGTLYGKNTTAGAVSLVTVSPGNTWTGRAEIQYAEQNDLRISGYAAGPLITDVLGLKVSAYRRKSDGYVHNPINGQSSSNQDVWGARGELRLTSGPVVLALRGDYTADRSTPGPQRVVNGLGTTPMDIVGYDHRVLNDRKGGGISLTADVDLGGVYGLTAITAWRTLKYKMNGDDDHAPLDLVYHDWLDKSRQVSQEIRISSPASGLLSWIVGGYYFHQQLDAFHPVNLTPTFFSLATQGAYNSAGLLDDTVTTHTDAYAAFANADYHFTNSLTLNLGLRYTAEKKKLDFVQTSIGGTVLLGYPSLVIKDQLTDHDLSPTASLSYKFSPQITGYIKYSKGFKSGGWNPDITTTTHIGFASENVTNYEAGIRLRTIDGKASFNLTGYHMKYDNLQVYQFLNTFAGYVITNAASAQIEGVEAELSVKPASWLTASTSLAYNSAKYIDFATGAGANYAGQQFINVPKLTVFAGLDAHLPLNQALTFIAHGDVRYQSRIYFDDPRSVVAAVGPLAQGGYALVNLEGGIEWSDRIQLSVFVKNLTNNRALFNRGFDTLSLGQTLDLYVPPRQFGARIAFSF